jgi:hypothetical protein
MYGACLHSESPLELRFSEKKKFFIVNRLAFTNYTTCNYFVKISEERSLRKSKEEGKRYAELDSASNKIDELPDSERLQGDRKSFVWERWKKICKNILTKVNRI